MSKTATQLTAAGTPLPVRLPARYNHRILADLSAHLRTWGWEARLAVRGDEVIAALPPRTSDGAPTPLLGLAVDIGTTKLAAYLIDLSDGQTLAKTGTMNPQIAYGEDVVSRIAVANTSPEGRRVLQSRLVSTLNEMVVEMCREANRSGYTATPQQIVDAVVVGNTAMHHLFAGLPVAQLGASPYVPAVADVLDIPADAVGLELAAGAYIHLPPNIAGYVGADHVAMVLATLFPPERMPPIPGEPLSPWISGRTPRSPWHTAGGCCAARALQVLPLKAPTSRMVCALLQAQWNASKSQAKPCASTRSATSLRLAFAVPESWTRFRKCSMRASWISGESSQKDHSLVHSENSRSWFLLAPAESSGHGRDVVITRKDINEIQLAKGAIRSGLEILFAEAGLTSQEIEAGGIDEFIVAGAFGTYINILSAIRVGMFPNLPLERFHQVGNAAGSGARQMLVSMEKRHLAQDIARRDEYIELSAHPNFTGIFSRALFFPTGEGAAPT